MLALKSYDVIIAGCGAMGSAISYSLASSGFDTLTIERFTLNHSFGSSHGRTRIIRTAYFEHPNYVPIVKRAYQLWRELEREHGEELMLITGGLMIGNSDSPLIKGVLKSAREHNLNHMILDSKEVAERYPVLKLRDEIAVYEPTSGILFPEKCIYAQKDLAESMGAQFHFEESVKGWRIDKQKVRIITNRDEYFSDKLVLSTGPWMKELVSLPLKCERQVTFWLKAKQRAELFSAESMPIIIWDRDSKGMFYCIPDTGDGIKVARHHGGEETDPDRVRRIVSKEDEEPIRRFMDDCIPDASGNIISSSVCLYTNTPDGHFIIDRHPSNDNIILVSACSGHGFKFSCAIGEIVKDIIERGKSKLDISLFRLSKFKRP